MSGYTASSWKTVATFSGRIATQADVETGGAVFALGDTSEGRPLDGSLPQPAMWFENDDSEEAAPMADGEDAPEPKAVLIVQAEVHETDKGTLEVLGLLMPDGTTAVGFMDDVDVVEPGDDYWESMVEEALFGGVA
ncbi:hypothetical protein BH09PSE2_BH09PSE2_17930 [soil metagenome]